MKNIIVTALFLLLSTNAFACYDASLSGKDNFDNCLVDAEHGDASAQLFLGYIFSEARNYKEAVKWYTKAAEQGHVDAITMLGVIYYGGEGVAQDYKEAVKWYTKAAEQGQAGAQHNLGNMYRKGQGVAQDYKSAHMWYNIAAANGYSTAVENRDLIAKEMTPSQIEKAQDMAREWMAKHQ